MRPRIYLSFSPSARALYYGDKALAGLRELGELRLNEREDTPTEAELIEAARDCQVLDQRPAHRRRPRLLRRAARSWRCSCAARWTSATSTWPQPAPPACWSRAPAPASATAVAEWVLGVMIDGARGISRSVLAYRSGAAPAITMGRELRGSRVGIIGYGHIGRRLGELALALGMHVAISDPQARPDDARIEALPLDALLAQSDFVVCLAPALPETENLMNAARLRAHAARRLLRQRLARQPGRRGRAAATRWTAATSPAARWTWAAPPTRCPRPRWRRTRR